jgi:hypothetical protein
MFAGHIGVGLVAGRFERRVNVGLFIAAALLLDLILWPFVALGWESVTIPADFATTRQAEYEFPYTHGLLASLLWASFAASVAFLRYGRRHAARWRAAGLVGGTVFSHWPLDALVHRPELPLAGAASPMVGLGLWNAMPLALGVESALALVGVALFLQSGRLSRGRALALATLSIVLTTFTVAGMTVAPAPPSALAMAESSLATLVTVCVLYGWIGSASG